MLGIGLVAEGRSDCVVLEAIARRLLPGRDLRFQTIRPDRQTGWQGVRAWCKEFGPKLEDYMTVAKAPPLHVLVIHVDGTIANKVSAEHPCPVSSTTADALREVIARDWLKRAPLPAFVVLVVPMRLTETWTVVALQLPYLTGCPIECQMNVEESLVRKHYLRRKDGEVKKPIAVYHQTLAPTIVKQLPLVRSTCLQADRFCTDLFQALPETHRLPSD